MQTATATASASTAHTFDFEPLPPILAHLYEPQHQYNRDPVLGKHPGLGKPALFGYVLAPLPARHLRAVHGTKTGKAAEILTPDAAAARLADAIHDATMVQFGHRYQRVASWLQLAVRLPETFAPLLHAPDVRAALLNAIGSTQPGEHVRVAA